MWNLEGFLVGKELSPHHHRPPQQVPILPALHIMSTSLATLASDHLEDRITST